MNEKSKNTVIERKSLKELRDYLNSLEKDRSELEGKVFNTELAKENNDFLHSRLSKEIGRVSQDIKEVELNQLLSVKVNSSIPVIVLHKVDGITYKFFLESLLKYQSSKLFLYAQKYLDNNLLYESEIETESRYFDIFHEYVEFDYFDMQTLQDYELGRVLDIFNFYNIPIKDEIKIKIEERVEEAKKCKEVSEILLLKNRQLETMNKKILELIDILITKISCRFDRIPKTPEIKEFDFFTASELELINSKYSIPCDYPIFASWRVGLHCSNLTVVNSEFSLVEFHSLCDQDCDTPTIVLYKTTYTKFLVYSSIGFNKTHNDIVRDPKSEILLLSNPFVPERKVYPLKYASYAVPLSAEFGPCFGYSYGIGDILSMKPPNFLEIYVCSGTYKLNVVELLGSPKRYEGGYGVGDLECIAVFNPILSTPRKKTQNIV